MNANVSNSENQVNQVAVSAITTCRYLQILQSTRDYDLSKKRQKTKSKYTLVGPTLLGFRLTSQTGHWILGHTLHPVLDIWLTAV